MPKRILVFRRSESQSLSQGNYTHAQTMGGQPTAKIMCPKCSLPLSLSGHEIREAGYVHPGVICPCGWRALIKLEGWGN